MTEYPVLHITQFSTKMGTDINLPSYHPDEDYVANALLMKSSLSNRKPCYLQNTREQLAIVEAAEGHAAELSY